MPLYTVEHCCPLTVPQQDELASAITELHSQTFTTPRLFVNVEFIDVSQKPNYVGGRRCSTNIIRGNVRTGPSRTQASWDQMCVDLSAAWDRIVAPGLPKVRRSDPDVNYKLHAAFIVGGLISIVESGFLIPAAGGDVQWLKENWAAFQKRADEGDEQFKDMLEEITQRGLVSASTNGVNGH